MIWLLIWNCSCPDVDIIETIDAEKLKGLTEESFDEFLKSQVEEDPEGSVLYIKTLGTQSDVIYLMQIHDGSSEVP